MLSEHSLRERSVAYYLSGLIKDTYPSSQEVKRDSNHQNCKLKMRLQSSNGALPFNAWHEDKSWKTVALSEGLKDKNYWPSQGILGSILRQVGLDSESSIHGHNIVLSG